MKKFSALYASLLLAGVANTALIIPAFAADGRDDKINALEQKLQDLLGEIRVLKQEQAAEKADKDTLTSKVQALQQAQTATATASAQSSKSADVATSFANGRLTFSTPDGRSTLNVRALMQFDSAYFSQTGRLASGTDLSSGTNIRRGRIGVDGRAFGDWSYSFVYDLGGSGTEGASISEGYIQYDGLAPFHVRSGVYPTPEGIDDQTSAADLPFLERSGPTDLARSIAGSDGRKNLISILAYDNDYYAAASLSGTRTAQAVSFDSQEAAVGRLSYRLYKDDDSNFIVSANGTYVFKVADAAASPAAASTSAITYQEGPENAVDGTRLVTTGAIPARKATIWGIESAGNWKNFYGQGGYYGFDISRRDSTLPNPNFHGWYVQGSWILTGEHKAYNTTTAAFGSPRPSSPFDFNGTGYGAWELTARYDILDLNYNAGIIGSAGPSALGSIRGGRQKAFTTGINWYPNSVIRFVLDYQHLDIDRLGTAAPFQQIGQKVDIAAARAQLAF